MTKLLTAVLLLFTVQVHAQTAAQLQTDIYNLKTQVKAIAAWQDKYDSSAVAFDSLMAPFIKYNKMVQDATDSKLRQLQDAQVALGARIDSNVRADRGVNSAVWNYNKANNARIDTLSASLAVLKTAVNDLTTARQNNDLPALQRLSDKIDALYQKILTALNYLKQ